MIADCAGKIRGSERGHGDDRRRDGDRDIAQIPDQRVVITHGGVGGRAGDISDAARQGVGQYGVEGCAVAVVKLQSVGDVCALLDLHGGRFSNDQICGRCGDGVPTLGVPLMGVCFIAPVAWISCVRAQFVSISDAAIDALHCGVGCPGRPTPPVPVRRVGG